MNEDATLLKTVFDNSQRTSGTLLTLLGHVENKALRTTIISQINAYDSINRMAGEEISSLGMKPKATGVIKSKISTWGKSISASLDPSLSHVAKIISEDTSASRTDTIGVMNRCVNSHPKVYNLARMLVSTDEASVNSIKHYL